MLFGVVVVVLELRDDIDDAQAQAPDPGDHSPVGRLVHVDEGIASVWLQVPQLRPQQFGFLLRISDDLGIAGELGGGVVARRDAVLVRPAGLGPPGARHVGIVTDDGEQHSWVGGDVRPRRVRACEVDEQVGALDHRMGRDDDRGLIRVVVRDDQLAERRGGAEPAAPFIGSCGVPGMDEHGVILLLCECSLARHGAGGID